MDKIGIDISINNEQLVDNNNEYNYIPTGVTYNNELYVDIETFSANNNVSTKTVDRKLKHVELSSKNNFCIRVFNKKFISPNLKVSDVLNFSATETLQGNWENFLRTFDWHYFATVRYSKKNSLLSARKHMETFFNVLSLIYPQNKLRMFFTTESNDEGGFHNHFILWTDIKSAKSVTGTFEKHFRGKGSVSFANTKINKYDPNQGGIGYILKELQIRKDGYDLKTKNLQIR